MDYTDLNDACPKDSFSLPRIDQIVDTSAGHGMLSFLDAFSGYHQIPMHPPDAEKTSFITAHGLYYYNVMPFGLKNVGATYQRLVTKMFQPLIGSTMEVYIDDMLVKSKQCPNHATHLQQAFDILREYGMSLKAIFFQSIFLIYFYLKRLIYVQKYGITHQTAMQQGIQEKEEFLQ